MKTLIAVLMLLVLSVPALAQSACAQLGVNCQHPNVAPRPASPSQSQTNDSDSSGSSHREYKNFYKAVDLGDKADKIMMKNPGQALHLLDSALALRRVSGEVRKQDQWARYECLRGQALLLLSRYDEALSSFAQCAGEDISDKNRADYDKWVKWGELAVDADRHPWAPLDVETTGEVTVVGIDGREWHNGEVMHANLRFATLKVAPNAKFKMTLPDGTMFTIFPNDLGGEMQMDDFVYDPNLDVHKWTSEMIKGSFRFITGKVAQHNPENMHMIMNLAVGSIGVRGTDFAIRVNPDSAETVVYLKSGAITWFIPGDYNGRIEMEPNSLLVLKDGEKPVYRTGITHE